MRVLFHAWRDLPHPQAGGSELLVDHLAQGLVARGHEVTLVAGGPTASRGYPVIDAGGTYTQYLRNPFTDRRLLATTDVVVDVANGMAACSPLWWRGPSVLIVNHVHLEQWSMAFPRPIAAVGRTLERDIIPRVYRSSLFAPISGSTATDLEHMGVPRRAIRQLALSPIDSVTSRATKSAEPQFLVLGRMVPHKRVEVALRAWEQVRPVSGGRLVVAGDGPERERLTELAGEGVELLGKVSDQQKADLLAESWCLIHPAAHEGWGLVITEAAVAGTPTLAFAVAGVVDSVATGESGVLVDTFDEFVAEWTRLAADSDHLFHLGEGARRFSAGLTADATLDSLETILEEAVESGGRIGRSRGRDLQT